MTGHFLQRKYRENLFSSKDSGVTAAGKEIGDEAKGGDALIPLPRVGIK